jgi:hypothetical protein
MKVIFILAVLTAFVIAWVTYVRPWLRKKEWAQGFFLAIEPVELFLYKKSEGIAWARWLHVLGGVLATAPLYGGIDWTWLAHFTPDYIDPILPLIPSILNAMGAVGERLRNDTTKPLEMVAVAEKDLTPEVVEKIAVAEVAKIEAVEAVKVAERTPP